ncbi:MAG: DNA-processing protein DprA, partial [Patescibacteria group bacterium]
TEKKYYNALAIALLGDMPAVRKLRGRFSDWRQAWSKLGKSVDPENAWEDLARNGIELIFQEEQKFPKFLREAPDAPVAVYCRGSLRSMEPAIAIVGTRKATGQAKELAKRFGNELAKAGMAIISGLALGIDAAAHEGALSAGGYTIAVLANSLESIYPKQNEGLAKKILDSGGALVSEYPIGSETLRYRFLERNRIVSGMANATLVIEAPERSGSLVTANMALEQNREVFVLPGPVQHPNYLGSHSLIRAGARLVTKPQEILEDLGIELAAAENAAAAERTNLSLPESAILQAVSSESRGISVDKIQEMTKMSVLDLSRHLTFLEIKGLIKEESGRYLICS